MAGYVGGRIKRIKIKNFMTYDNVEIYPKKGLNLIIGLNGTGKSSIMCAICLGLAGRPQFTGRATQLSDFIKHGCEEAEIEIELESKNNYVVIRRKLRGERCEWYINKKPSNQNEVASLVKKFNIDTSNICQFLPQEKVSEFSRMDKKQRLENMLQAIGEPHLFELFRELKELCKQVCEIEQSLKKFQMNKNSAVEENMRISDEVLRQENRSRLKEELIDLNKKKIILTYKQIYDEFQELKNKIKSHEKVLTDLHKERDEAAGQEDIILKAHSEGSKKFKELKNQSKILMTKLINNSNMLTNFHEQVENEKIEYKNKLAEKEAQKRKLQHLNTLIESLEKQLKDEIDKCASLEERNRVNTQALSQLQLELSELDQKIVRATAEKNQVEYSVNQLKSQLSSLQDEQNKKMENLKRCDKHTYQATCWLRENEGRFKSKIYLPIMTEININSSEDTKYVENVIPFRDMIAFVCEDRNDCEMLTDILKKQMKLCVNIVMAPDNPLSAYTYFPLTPEYRKYGLDCYVKDLFTAPEPVMRYLCACCHIHKIPVAKSGVNSNNTEFILERYSTFFSENMRISGKRSKYGERNLSILQDFIISKNLLVNCNDELQNAVSQRLQEMQQHLESKQTILEEYKDHRAEKERIQAKLRHEKKEFSDLEKNIQKLKSIHIQKQKYRMQISVFIDEDQEKDKVTRKIQSINERREDVLAEFNSSLKEFIQLEKEIAKLILTLNCLSKNLKLTVAANEDIHDRVKAAENEHEKLTKKFQEKKHEGQSLLKNIDNRKIADIHESIEEIEEKINHVQAELNLNEDNEPLVAEYYTRKRKIESIQQRIHSFSTDLERLKQTIQEKRKEWLDSLLRHIENINKKFSHYFKQLSCAGEISLDIPENPDDFSQYGLQIKLKFHDDTPFTELSQTHHSGGECSVAAIVFILSLQELTEVPFRCIDEINQGMDSINERKIYQLIADSVGQDRCSQYFLLTPKLLDGLDYPDDVAVHIIFNSCFLKAKLDVKKHLEIARTA